MAGCRFVVPIALVCLSGLGGAALGQSIRYVDDDASTNGDGLAWDTAYKYLQDALFEAANDPGITEIRVAGGTYKPDEDEGGNVIPGDREATFALIGGVGVYGGYAGWADPSQPDQRDVVAYETVLSGDLSGDDEPSFVNNDENSYHVVTGTGLDVAPVLDGFTISGGNASGSESSGSRSGGGLYNHPGRPTVANCIFKDNFAIDGGAVYNAAGSTPALSSCRFVNNAVSEFGMGGGMLNIQSSPSVTDCTFSGNFAGYGGGGVCSAWDCAPELVNCRFLGNSAGVAGGGMYDSGNTPTLINCAFSGNSADWGGGIYSWGSVLALVNCTISGNTAGDTGGGMANRGTSDPTLTNCILWGNQDSGGADESAQIDGWSDPAHVSFSCIEGLDALSGNANIGDDPLLARNPDVGPDGEWGSPDDDFGDLHLSHLSPCLDAGTNGTDPPLPDSDLDGNPRIVDGIVDMGAYEGFMATFVVDGAPVTVPEGATGSFTVALAQDPGGLIQVTVAYDAGDGDITVESGHSLTFNSSDYWIARTVVLAAAHDADWFEDLTRLRISAEGIAAATVLAQEAEDDPVALVFVDADADTDGARDGGSWADAFTELSDALCAAAAWPGLVEEVWVAEGAYTPAGPGGDRAATFQLVSGIAVYGGFAGWETDLDQRDPSANLTILSGDLDGDDRGDVVEVRHNSYHVVTGSGTNSTAILDGFVIAGGWATGPSEEGHDLGAGMYNDAGSPTVSNCTFTDNRAMQGGGVCNRNGSAPTLTDCSFTDNSAPFTGGGMYNTDSNPALNNCVFTGNWTGQYGGGMFNNNSSNPSLAACVFIHNFGTWGGGLCNQSASSPVLNGCTFSANSAVTGGGLYNSYFSDPMLVNCVFAGNSADYGGGLANFVASAVLTNCSLSNNLAHEDGGGILSDATDEGMLTVVNCVLWGNRDSGDDDESAQIQVLSGPASVTFSCIEGLGGLAGNGNIAADPLFVREPHPGPDDDWGGQDDDFGDLHLACTSPCLDAGTNGTDPPLPDTDLEGNPRILNDIVDMGAYEGPNPAFAVWDDPVVVLEGGGETFTYALRCDPGGPIDALVEYDLGDSDITVESGQMCTFDSSDFWVPRTVTLAAAEDDDQVENAARFRISAAGIGFATVLAREMENDLGPVVFVDDDADGANDGNSWADALNDLQLALSMSALAPAAVQDIWVAQGIYTPAEPDGERTATLQLRSGLGLYGGFAGWETDLDQRDPGLFAHTILSGDLAGDDDLDTDGGINENSYHVVTAGGTDSSAVLDGFTISDGNADGNGTDGCGGGMFNLDGCPTVANCTFLANQAAGYECANGGGMYNAVASPTLINSVFCGNTAGTPNRGGQGGGMFNDAGAPLLIDCSFIENAAYSSGVGGGYGGGMCNTGGGATLANCAFNNNWAGQQGGGMYNYGSGPVATGCTFSGNSAQHGGGIYNSLDGDPLLTDCVFGGNWADGEGGGILPEP